ncbi:MAG: outer membrane beta-barrel protein [Tunicatimonas sp.]
MKNYPRRATGAFGGLLSLLLLMFNPLAQAQDQSDASSDPSGAVSTDGGGSGGGLLSEITYGGKIGLTSSGFYKDFFEGRPHTGSLSGLVVGGFASYSVLDFLDVSAELLYMQQGGTRVELKESIVNRTPVAITGNVRLHNVEFPVLLRATLPNLDLGFKPQLVIGPSVGYNVAAVQSQDVTYFLAPYDDTQAGLEAGAFSTTNSGSENVRSEYQSMQYGLNIGLGVEIPMEAFTLVFDTRYRYGINPVNNGFDANDLLRDATDQRSNSFVFSLGVGF